MDTCEVNGCGQPTEFGIIFGGKRACPDCWLRHCDPDDPIDLKKPGTFVGRPAIFTRRATAIAVAAVEPALFA